MLKKFGYRYNKRAALLQTAAASAIATLVLTAPAQAIVPNDNYKPADIIDNAGGVNGVGMFYRDDGFVCSGTLINPRAVLFAAHCVNDRPETDYDTDGVVASAFSFNVDALPGFRDWIRNGYVSNPDLFVYNISQIAYNPDSIAREEGFGFLEGDIAIATLSDPAANIPTWALLFSPLPDPGEIDDVDGTGYHVKITGYGRSGSGTKGSNVGIDWRRRAAENMLGSLSNFNDRDAFLFGDNFGDLPQVLYRLDFDDPNETNPFDFNLYKDEPRKVEGTTAGGDSGGPLILDAANNSLSDEDLQIGVLSGGSRFFSAQVFSSYGTESFYQPLFLFADYIAATNPYRYVSAKAGDGKWEDAAHWQTDLDPAYRIIDANGNVVNGFPDKQPGGITQDSPQFGEVCFDERGDNPDEGCADFATGEGRPPARNNAGADVTSNIGKAAIASATAAAPVIEASAEVAATALSAAPAKAGRPTLAANIAIRDGMIVDNVAISSGVTLVENVAISDGASPLPVVAESVGGAEQQPQAEGDPFPAPTLANGLVGATNFVPQNNDGDVASGVKARYFEVTLKNAGTTNLSSAARIDRLNVGGTAGLLINSNGALTAEIDVNQTGGRVAVNGSLTSAGDYSLFSGLLSGTGTVTAPYVTSIAGGIAPGTMGTIGKLTIDGNLVLSSGSTLFIDVGANQTSDLLAVTGEANIGGVVAVAPAQTFQTATPSTFRILTAEGGVTNRFKGAGNVSAILLSELLYSANAVDLRITAQSYQKVVAGNNPVQVSYASLMDQNRGNAALAGIFSVLDFADAKTIQAAFDSWAPTTEATTQGQARAVIGNIADFHENRISLADRSTNGGTVAVIGRPLQLASASLGGQAINASAALLNDAAANAGQGEAQSGGVNEDMAVFLAGGYIDGRAASMPLRNPRPGADGEDDFDGYYIAGGVEYYFDEASFIGVSAYYSDIDGVSALSGTKAGSKAILGSIYGRAETFWDLIFDGRVTAGNYKATTRRNVALGSQPYSLTSSDNSFVYATEVGLSKELNVLETLIVPGIRGRAAKVNFSNVTEEGGLTALLIERPDYTSVQGLAGLEFKSKPEHKLQLRASMNFVHEFKDSPNTFAASFVGGNGLPAPFALADQDRDWGELGFGLRYNVGSISFDASIDTTVGRSDAQSQVYSGAVTFRF